jgi:hypothetical protein
MLGFAITGGVWGLLGGAVMGIPLSRAKLGRGEILAGLALMEAGTYAGWKLLNEPKLIYFSNRVDKPREELWFGLALGGVALLGWLWRRRAGCVAGAMALWGLLWGSRAGRRSR